MHGYLDDENSHVCLKLKHWVSINNLISEHNNSVILCVLNGYDEVLPHIRGFRRKPVGLRMSNRLPFLDVRAMLRCASAL